MSCGKIISYNKQQLRLLSMKKILFLLLTFTQFAMASGVLRNQDSLEDFGHIDSIENDKLIYFTDLLPAKELHSTNLSFLEDENLTPGEKSLSMLLARAQFRIDYSKVDLDPAVVNTDKNLRVIYNSSLNSKVSSNLYNMTKTKVVVKINYQLEFFSTKTGTLEGERNQMIIDESRALDNSSREYLGSVIHEQRNFSKLFETGILVANVYKVSETEIVVSAYNLSYVRNSAIRTLNNVLIWSSARKELNKEIRNSLWAIFRAAKKF